MLRSDGEYEDRLIRDAHDSEGVFIISYTRFISRNTILPKRCINFVPAVQESKVAVPRKKLTGLLIHSPYSVWPRLVFKSYDFLECSRTFI